LFLCALLTNASPNARVRLIDSAIRASKEKPNMAFDNQAKGQYRKVIQNCSKLRDINRTTALKAIDSIQNHELAGAILQALLEGASPYTMLALANIGESKDNASSSASPVSVPLPMVKKITNFGDADKPVPQRMMDSIRTALADRKKCKISYGQHCAAVYAHKLLKTNIHAVQLIINIILDKDGSVVSGTEYETYNMYDTHAANCLLQVLVGLALIDVLFGGLFINVFFFFNCFFFYSFDRYVPPLFVKPKSMYGLTLKETVSFVFCKTIVV
jgi:hypothetical protein